MSGIMKTVIGGTIALIGGAAVGVTTGWCGRGRKENKRHAEHQKVILALEKRLRKNEEELKDTKTLSQAKITQLREERDRLRKQIAGEKTKAT